jgi:hypothetical protein
MVNPRNAWFGRPPTQMDANAATYRNHAIVALQSNDIGRIVYQYLLNRINQREQGLQMLVFGGLCVGGVMAISSIPLTMGASAVLAPAVYASLATLQVVSGASLIRSTSLGVRDASANARSFGRYRKTKRLLKKRLEGVYGPALIARLEKISSRVSLQEALRRAAIVFSQMGFVDEGREIRRLLDVDESRDLDPRFILDLQDLQSSPDTACLICYEDIADPSPNQQGQDHGGVFAHCLDQQGQPTAHFHAACIRKWIQRSSLCPKCRVDLPCVMKEV